MIPAVIYARYSSSNQREESIAGQIRECHAYAEKNGFKVIKEYTDSALTGKTDKRPGFQAMIRDSDQRRFQAVIVWKLDRFARDRYDAAFYRKHLKDNGVRLISAMEAISDSPEGIILEGLLEAMAEYYSANLSENIKRGYYDSALQRKMVGTKTLGYRKGPDGRYEIDPNEAPIVRRIFKEYLSGKNRQAIIDDLNRDGFRTSKNKPFTKNSLYTILKNDKYIGIYRFKDIYDPEGIPAIISPENFKKAQELMEMKEYRKKNITAGYQLASKLFCGECGSAMTGESATSRSGDKHYYYTCIGRKGSTKNGCNMPRIQKDWIEQKMIRIVNDLILTDETIDMFVETYRQQFMNRPEDEELKIYQAELKETEKKIQNVMKAIESGIWSETVQTRLAELESDRDRLHTQIEEKEREEIPVTPEMVRDYFLDLRTRAKTDDECQMTLMDVFLRKVYLFKPTKKHGPMKAVFEISLTGSNGKPVAYNIMLEQCSSELSSVEATVNLSNHTSLFKMIAFDHSLFLLTLLENKSPQLCVSAGGSKGGA